MTYYSIKVCVCEKNIKMKKNLKIAKFKKMQCQIFINMLKGSYLILMFDNGVCDCTGLFGEGVIQGARIKRL